VLIRFNQGIQFGDNTIQTTAGGAGSMVYPGVGLAVSTGAAWGASVPNNSAFWNTSYSWGNHAGLYKPISYVPTWNEVTSKPVFHIVATSGNYNDLSNKPEPIELEAALPTLPGIRLPVLTQTQINALVPVKGLLLFNDTDGVLQIYNGTVWKVVITNL
jgi:hypothetical protein